MKNLIAILGLFAIISCNEDEIIIPVEDLPTINGIYTYTNTSPFTNYKYYKGPNGENYPSEALNFLKTHWPTYNESPYKSIELKKDSVIVTSIDDEVERLKSSYKNDLLIINYDTLEIVFGKVDKKTNTFHVYRNYFDFHIISKTNGSSANVEGDFFGLWSDADFFPSLVNSPKDFTHKDEFLFWGNISHNFKKK